MSKNDNQNSKNDVNKQKNDYHINSEYLVITTSEKSNRFSRTSMKLNKNVKILNEENPHIGSLIEDVLQQCDEYIDPNRAGPSNEYNSKRVAIIHQKQFDNTSSSDHFISEPTLSNERFIRSSNIMRPLSNMSEATFRCFVLQNFPSAVDFRRKSSSTWHNLVIPKRPIRKTNDNSTQFIIHDLPSIEENDTTGQLFSRQVVTTTSQQIQITPSLVPPRPIQGNPPLEGAPPSYSAVLRIGTADAPSRRIFGRRIGSHIEPSAPFISRSPPPSYAEAQGHYYRPVVVDSELIWGPDPMPAVCQRCGTHVLTTTTSQRSNLTHFAAVALCLCGCWPCCLLPYCMNSCKNTYHYCPNCSTYLGMYRPW